MWQKPFLDGAGVGQCDSFPATQLRGWEELQTSVEEVGAVGAHNCPAACHGSTNTGYGRHSGATSEQVVAFKPASTQKCMESNIRSYLWPQKTAKLRIA